MVQFAFWVELGGGQRNRGRKRVVFGNHFDGRPRDLRNAQENLFVSRAIFGDHSVDLHQIAERNRSDAVFAKDVDSIGGFRVFISLCIRSLNIETFFQDRGNDAGHADALFVVRRNALIALNLGYRKFLLSKKRNGAGQNNGGGDNNAKTG